VTITEAKRVEVGQTLFHLEIDEQPQQPVISVRRSTQTP